MGYSPAFSNEPKPLGHCKKPFDSWRYLATFRTLTFTAALRSLSVIDFYCEGLHLEKREVMSNGVARRLVHCRLVLWGVQIQQFNQTNDGAK